MSQNSFGCLVFLFIIFLGVALSSLWQQTQSKSFTSKAHYSVGRLPVVERVNPILPTSLGEIARNPT
jgi:hypothetical protein